MIYFINRGKIQLLRNAATETESVVRTLGENDNLGLDDFTNSSGRRVRHTARSLTYCDVMSLSTEELSAALEHDAAERVKEEALKVKREKEMAVSHTNSASPAGEGKGKNLAACLRKAGNIAKMSAAFGGGKKMSITVTPDRSEGASAAEEKVSSSPVEPLAPAPGDGWFSPLQKSNGGSPRKAATEV